MQLKKAVLRKIIVGFLSISLCLTLMPVLPASATSNVVPGEVKKPVSYANLDALKTAYPSGYKGNIVRFVETDAADTLLSSDYVRVDFGTWNLDGAADVFEYRLKYDPATVEVAMVNSGVLEVYPLEWIGAEDYIIVPRKYKEEHILTADETIKTKLLSSYIFENSSNGFTNAKIGGSPISPILLKLEGAAVTDIGVDKTTGPTAFTGHIGFALSPSGGNTSPVFSKNWLKIAAENDKVVTAGLSEPIYIASIYFKKTQGINSETFSMYSSVGIAEESGSAAEGNAQVLTKKVVFLDFPQPAAATSLVPFEVTATAATDTKVYLPNPAEVTITKRDGGTTQNYKSNSSGKLLTAAGAALSPESTLALEAGIYDYTVTPHTDDLATYAANNGTFTVENNDTTQKQLHAKLKGEAAAETYSFNLFDGESAKDDVPLADAVIQVGGTTATNNNGAISFQAIPGTSPTINISKTGYKTLSGNVAVGATGTGTITSMTGITFNNGAVVMDQTRTNVTIEAKAGTTALADAIITVSANPAADKKVTPNMAANELPIVKKADTNGKVSFNLPNGDYLYTIRAGGYSDTVKSLAIAEKVTVADADGNNAKEPINKVAAGDDFTAEIPAASAGTPGAITEPMYYVVGKLDKEENPTKMTVEVFLKNTKASKGTFGLKYDSAMFKLAATDGFVKSDNIEQISSFSVDGKGTVSNPVSGSGYHAFQWNAAAPPIDATGAAELIGTYTLELQPGFSKDKLHSKSLYVAPYSKTDAATQILDAYEGNAAYANEFISRYWRPTDAANNAPTDTHRLPAALATEGGFYQIYKSGEEGSVFSSDARAQFVFDNSGANGVTFSVNETADGNTAGAPIMGATIKIKEGDKVISTLTTDQYGDATVGLPAGGSYTYTVTCLGYQTKTDTAVPANTDPISVLLSADESHKVRVDDTQLDKIDLLGANRVQNNMDYTFNLQPKAGYKWVTAGGPTPAQISFELTDGTNTTAIDSSNITWDAVASCYKLAGAVITGDAKQDLVVSVADGAITSTTTADAPTITVKAIGAGGKFDVTPDTGGNSTFNPTVTTDMTAVVETLGAGKGTSATYAFKEGGPVTGGQTPAEGTYEAYIINKLLINGAEVQLTDTQKIHGVSKQLIEVNNNQTITAIYEKATVDLKEPGDEDDVILPEPPIVPTANPLVSIVVGEGGDADVTVSDPSVTVTTVTGPGRAEYQVAASSGTFIAVITPNASLPQPDNVPKAYVIDTVMVDGVKVNDATPAATWDAANNKLTLTGLLAGKTHTVAVTFKPTDAPGSTEAILNTVHVDGNGKITPLGTNIYKVGDCPTVRFEPDTQWVLGKLELTEPAETPATIDVTDKVENNTYKLDALDAGITELKYTFKEQSFVVQLGVDYLNGIKPMTGATIIFERSAGGSLPAKKLQYEMAAPTGSQVTGRFEVPEGTWKVTLKKNGFLPYTVTGFTIDKDGNAAETYKDAEGVLHFGMATETSGLKCIEPIIGDANRDEVLIALDDAAQIIEGMVSGANQGIKDYADLDENGEVSASDQVYVSGNFGKRAIVRTYTDFLAK